ncbi:prolyl-tRNA synthetase associated domain-containing protein [Oceanisphaera pacifica]|uniref:Prolyl-tRNA synthetase associated domain-containing protein n=1 Tax=Oceanisphaera pacifica TaxID=2818389 RepID=A0ABS3NDG5_9GAMM|nr:prolyl-tRNA synthetase associated domain-containing protein [Oceanisphaera pacifica]MBO1518632.1 prolyl-tRNA synthetase associated domain-containing protein [Oceanisphaera pacifica]
MDILEKLTSWQITPPLIEHPPLFNCDEADRLLLERPGTRLKNLFLRDNYGRRHALLLTKPDKQVDLKALSSQLGWSRIGFASAERLDKYLGVAPGHVSVLALINDANAQAVELWLDNDLSEGDDFHCHPLRNTATVLLSKVDLARFAEHTGHTPQWIDVPER